MAETTIQCRRCRAEIPGDAAFCPRCGECTTPGRAAGPVLIGFTILRVLGHGGAAVVYLARQEALDRRVAVKVLRRDVEDPKAWRRFRREAQTIARLSTHPNVVTVYTAGRSEAGEPYIVTELLDRGSLSDIIHAEGPLPPGMVTTIGVAVADALTAAHAMGILHRDVKPANVFLDQNGRVKLGDFGIARLLGGQSITTTDVVAFTPEHVAPEILRGELDGPWSDVYGLASTLATALIGRSLYARGPDERVDALLSRKLTAPSPALPRTVPASLREPVERALDPDPARRPPLNELRGLLAAEAATLGAPVSLPPPAPGTAGLQAPVRVTTAASASEPRQGSILASPLRRRSRLYAVGALLGAIIAVTVGVGLLADLMGQREDGSSATNPVEAAPTNDDEAASQSSVTVSRASTPTSASISTAATTTLGPTTTARPTTAAPAPLPPPPATTSPPSSTAGEEAVLLTAERADAFVRSYYDMVETGNYEASWSQLTPEFQRGKARSYEYYVEFWNQNDLEVGDVELVTADRDRATVNVELRWNGSRDAVVDQFTLRATDDGQPLISDQTTLGG